MSFSALIPADQMAAANATLDSQGFGPRNFSVPVYGAPRPNYATLHAWNDPIFQAAVEAISGVTVSSIDGTPAERVADALSGLSNAGWGGNAPPLEGQVTPGLYRDDDGVLWWVIQPYDTATYPDPSAVPALVRKARIPGEVTDWVQPIDQFDAYLLENPFSGEPERVMHNGTEWVTTLDVNVWEPGTQGSGWTPADGSEPPGGDTPEWQTGVSYSVGDRVTYQGTEYECLQAHTSQAGWNPAAVPALWSAV